MNKTFIITGGAGFIGSAVIRHIINNTPHSVINVDKLTYAGNLDSLSSIENSSRYIFENIDICNASEVKRVINNNEPDIVMHLAAESHVDRSITGPEDFIRTNVFGTYVLIEESKNYWLKLKDKKKEDFLFHHVSTDEVYGDLSISDEPFKEDNPYLPSSPYSASKASSDHLVRAWNRTYNIPTLVTNCSNNYGPYQFPEKLIPLMILNALDGKNLPIYGDGMQVRDWLYVDDHAEALTLVALNGDSGETYNIGGHNEHKNIDVVKTICSILDKLYPCKLPNINKYEELITYVKDRDGHDNRYAINANKIAKEIKWKPKETFETGIKKTVVWYIENMDWIININNRQKKSYK
tara:strand:+ start:3361 stop:4416 length:1056 start_codon:yes stop_codon:yes gene_type:complete